MLCVATAAVDVFKLPISTKQSVVEVNLIIVELAGGVKFAAVPLYEQLNPLSAIGIPMVLYGSILISFLNFSPVLVKDYSTKIAM